MEFEYVRKSDGSYNVYVIDTDTGDKGWAGVVTRQSVLHSSRHVWSGTTWMTSIPGFPTLTVYEMTTRDDVARALCAVREAWESLISHGAGLVNV